MKQLKVLSHVLKALIAISGALLFIGWLVAPTTWTKPLSYLATIVLPFVPDLFRLIKVEFSIPLTLAYEVFLVIAMILGIDLNWYSEVLVAASGDSYYDKIVHFSSGVLTAVVGQEFFNLQKRKNGGKYARWFQVIFLLGVVAIVAVGWECYEFLYDEIFGGHMQELVKSGVADTMWDMIASLIGGSLCIFCLLRIQSFRAQKTSKTQKSN